MKRTTTLPALLLAAGLALAGCAGTEPGAPPATSGSPAMPGMDHGTSGSSSPESGAQHNAADTMFAQMMVPHHEQAVDMSEMMLAKDGLDTQIVDLAGKIKAAQGPEIEKMNSWLQAWGEPADSGSMDHQMEGMMGPDDLAKLEAAQGQEATRLFLTQMVAHHKGAVKMAEEEVANGSNPEAVDLAKKVVADQNSEIKEMEALLADYR